MQVMRKTQVDDVPARRKSGINVSRVVLRRVAPKLHYLSAEYIGESSSSNSIANRYPGGDS